MKKSKILIVEDESIVAQDVKRSLVKLGYDVSGICFSGEDALSSIENDVPDLVLMDIVLKGEMNGIETAEEIRRHFKIPVVYVTAYADDDTLRRAIETEPFGYIIKPIEKRELHSTIRMAMYKHSMDKKTREREAWFSTTLMSIGDAVITIDSMGRVAFLNPVAESLFGVKLDAALGNPFRNLCRIIGEEEHLHFCDQVQCMLAEGIGRKFNDTIVLLNTQEEEIIVDSNCAPILDEKGGIQGVVIVLHDITERRTAEKMLQVSEERFRETTEMLPTVICEVDLAGRVTYINKAGYDLSGYSAGDFASGIGAIDIIHPDDRQRAAENISKIIMGEKISANEYRMVKKDGSIFHVIIESAPMFSGTELTGIRSNINDITELKLLTEQLQQSQKMEAVGRLAGGIAHDFNNILMAIKGYGELLSSRLDKDDKRRNDVAEILKAAGRASSLTRQLLAFSRKQLLQKTVLDLNVVIADIEKMLNPILGENVEVVCRLEEDLDLVNADKGQIEQVIMNLAINSSDAMPNGGELLIRTENVKINEDMKGLPEEILSGNYVCLSIEDNGAGMDSEVLKHVFEPFYSTKEAGKGTGLGLSVVYGIVKQHNGWIDLDSEIGRGTLFKIYLPAFLVEKDNSVVETNPVVEVRGYGEGILVVEDDKDVCELAVKVLKDNGYTVFSASCAKDAFDSFEKNRDKIRLVFSDVVLPDKDGITLADELLAVDPDLPIIFTSGYTDARARLIDIFNKGYQFLEKPYTLDDLFRSIRRALGG